MEALAKVPATLQAIDIPSRRQTRPVRSSRARWTSCTQRRFCRTMLARITFALAVIITAVFASPADALNRAEFRQRFGPFVDMLRADPHAPPGFVIVVTSGSRTLFA